MVGWLEHVPASLVAGLVVMVGWLRQSWLNLSKTDILWLGNSGMGLGSQLPALHGVPLTLAPTVKSLGKILDASLTMEAQVTRMSRVAFLQLRQVQQLTPSLSCFNIAAVIHSTVTSRLDYYNSFYVRLPLRLTWIGSLYKMQLPGC